jgi:hypothetical protein
MWFESKARRRNCDNAAGWQALPALASFQEGLLRLSVDAVWQIYQSRLGSHTIRSPGAGVVNFLTVLFTPSLWPPLSSEVTL